MSILIPGMEMPDNCYNNCPFFTQIQPGIDHGLINYCCLENWKKPITPLAFSVDEAKQGRQPFCPLVPVHPHGRLIDADALEKDIDKYIGGEESRSRFHHWVQVQSVVIPGDKGEET